MAIDVEKYLANRLKYHAASRVATQEGQSLAQALNLDAHTVTSQKVWAGALSGFPVNTASAKGTTDGVAANIDLVAVFKDGATSAAWYGSDETLGVVWTNTTYPNVKLFENVVMTPVKGSDEVNSGKTVYESYEILSGVTTPTPSTPIEGKPRIQDWVSPMAVFDSSNSKPVPGFTARIVAGTSLTGQFTDLHTLKSDWALANGTWEFIYSAGMVTFAKGYTPIGESAQILRFTGFQYIGQYLDASLATKDAKVASDISIVSGAVDDLSGKVEDAFGAGSKVVISKEDGITKSDVVIGGATLADTALSTTLATEAAVRNAIDTKAISIEGIDAIGVSGTSTAKSIYLTLAPSSALEQSADGLKSTLKITKLSTPTSSGYAASYQLQDIDGNIFGDTIDIVKDQVLKDVVFIPSATEEDVTKSGGTVALGDPCVKFTFTTHSEDKVVYVNLKNLVDTYTGTSGVAVSGYTIYGVVDPTSEKYLTVDTNGFKVSGIASDIDAASSFLSTAITEVSAAVAASAAAFAEKDEALDTKIDAVSTAVAASAVTFDTNISTLSTNLGLSSETASSGTAFGRIASLEDKVGTKSVATQISEYDAANIDPRLDVVESKLKDIAAEDGAVLTKIQEASGYAYDQAKSYTDSQISTLEGKAAASAVTAETNAKSYTDSQITTLEGKAAASAIAASGAAYTAASTDLATFKNGEYATLSGRVDTIDAALTDYLSANAVSNKFKAVDEAIEEASKGSSQALSTFITGTYNPEQAVQNTRLTNLETYVSGTNGLKSQIDANAIAAATSAAGISAIVGNSTDTAAEDGTVFARIAYNKENISTLSSDLSAVSTAIATSAATLDTKIDAVSTAVAASAVTFAEKDTALDTKIDAVSTAVATSAVVFAEKDTALDTKIDAVSTAVAASAVTFAEKDTALDTKIDAVSTAVAASAVTFDSNISTLSSYLGEVSSAVATSAVSFDTRIAANEAKLVGIDSTVTGYVTTKIGDLGQVFKFKGYTPDKTSGTLPTATSATVGDVYLVDQTIDTITYTAQYVGVSDSTTTPVTYRWQKLGVKTSVGSFATKEYVDIQDGILSTAIKEISGSVAASAVTFAEKDEALDTKIDVVSTAVAASAVTFDTNISTLSSDLGAISAAVAASAVTFAEKDEALDTKIDAVSTAVAASAVTFDSNISTLSSQLDGFAASGSAVKNYIDTADQSVKDYADGKFVTIAEHEALSAQYIALNTKMDEFWKTLSGQIK